MSSNAPSTDPSRRTRAVQLVAEVAIIAAILLWVPLLNDWGQTTTIFGVSVPTAIVVTVFWVLGVIGGGVFAFRWR
jgi:hypothetical protein